MLCACGSLTSVSCTGAHCCTRASASCMCALCTAFAPSCSCNTGTHLLLHATGSLTNTLLPLQDEFPENYRFTASTFPSEDDDVVTSPYNAMLSLAELTQHADAVLPLENQALLDICSLLDSKLKPTVKPGSLATGPEAGGSSQPLCGSAWGSQQHEYLWSCMSLEAGWQGCSKTLSIAGNKAAVE